MEREPGRGVGNHLLQPRTGVNPLCSRLPRRQRPDPRASSGYSRIPVGAQPHRLFLGLRLRLGCPPAAWVRVARRGAAVHGTVRPERLVVPKGLRLMRVGEGRLAPTLARCFLAEPGRRGAGGTQSPAPGRDALRLPPCPVPTAGARPDPAPANNTSQGAPRSRGPGDRGKATRSEMPQSRSERCGEQRAQHTSPCRFPACTGRCRLDRSFL